MGDMLDALANMPDETADAFRAELKAAMKKRRMTQRGLAEFSAVDHTTISRLLSGARHEPSLRTAIAVAKGLQTARPWSRRPYHIHRVQD